MADIPRIAPAGAHSKGRHGSTLRRRTAVIGCMSDGCLALMYPRESRSLRHPQLLLLSSRGRAPVHTAACPNLCPASASRSLFRRAEPRSASHCCRASVLCAPVITLRTLPATVLIPAKSWADSALPHIIVGPRRSETCRMRNVLRPSWQNPARLTPSTAMATPNTTSRGRESPTIYSC